MLELLDVHAWWLFLVSVSRCAAHFSFLPENKKCFSSLRRDCDRKSDIALQDVAGKDARQMKSFRKSDSRVAAGVLLMTVFSKGPV